MSRPMAIRLDSEVSAPVAAAERVLAQIHAAAEELAPYFHPLGDDERRTLPPVPNALAEVAPTMIEALRSQPALVAFVPDFDLAATEEGMARLVVLRTLENQVEQLLRTVHDSVRSHESALYSDLLPVYQTAKVGAERDAALKAVVAPLQKMFAARRAPRKKTGER